MNIKDLRKLSLEFRRLSSNFLNSTHDTADANLSRFVSLITTNELIRSIIEKKIAGVEYDFKDCFGIEDDGWAELSIPADEAQHVKAQCDYLNFINSGAGNLMGQAMRFYHSSNKLNDIIQSFIERAFKPLIDFINDQLSMEMIGAEEDAKQAGGNTYIQHIDRLTGTANQQGRGTITSYTTNNAATREILDLTAKLIETLPKLEGFNEEELDSVKDDLESIQEQLKGDTPKKNRLIKALGGIKKFVAELTQKVGVSLAANAILSTDWLALIAQLEQFIQGIAH